MKKLLTTLFALLLTAGLTACTSAPAASQASQPDESSTSSAPSQKPEENVELTVFAAASLTETLDEISKAYSEQHPGVQFTFNFDSSGTLQTQIEEGAECDLFLSAAQKQMDALEKGGFIDPDSRIDLLENKVVLAVPKGNPAGIKTFADIGTDKCSLIALGNDDVPVGAYSIEILTSLGLLEGLENSQKITYGSNVKEVTTQVSEGVVDCGIVYATDAFSAGLEVAETADPSLCSQVLYPAAVLKGSSHAKAASEFLAYLQGDEARTIFEKVGFTVIDAESAAK